MIEVEFDLEDLKQKVGDRMETCEDSFNEEYALKNPDIFKVTQTTEQKAKKVPRVTIERIWKQEKPLDYLDYSVSDPAV